MNVGVDNRAKAINQIFVGVNNIAKLVYSSSGGSGSFELPTFTGSSSVFGDELSGRIELYESGTLTLSPGTYDFFLVGGGASGAAGSDTNTGGGGGGSGYSTTQVGVEITGAEGFISVIVGAGSLQSSGNAYTGSQTAITISHDLSITANPGQNGGRYTYGSNGGCGGGSSGGAGGCP